MLVKMLVKTSYKGVKQKGKTYEVSAEVAERWKTRNIALIVDKQEPIVLTEQSSVAAEPKEAPDYNSMSVKALFKLCCERKIVVDPRQSKDYYIERLENADTE